MAYVGNGNIAYSERGPGTAKLAKITSNHQHSVVRKTPTLSSIPKVANYVPQAKSSPPLIFINKVLFKHSHTHSFTYCLWFGCFHTTRAMLSHCHRDHKTVTIWPFIETLPIPDLPYHLQGHSGRTQIGSSWRQGISDLRWPVSYMLV